MGVVNFKAPYMSGLIEARIVEFLTQVDHIKCYQMDDISLPTWAWLWSYVVSTKHIVLQQFTRRTIHW